MSDELDVLDLKIIARLADNARISNREIARELGLTEGTIRTRLKRLTDRNAIRVTAVTNIGHLRNPILAHLWIDVESSEEMSAVVEALAALPEINFVSALLGRADILAMMLVRDAGELANYLHQTVDRIPGIHRIQYSLAQKYFKHDFRYTIILPDKGKGPFDS